MPRKLPPPAPLWMLLPAKLPQEKATVSQRQGESEPEPLEVRGHRIMNGSRDVIVRLCDNSGSERRHLIR